MSTPPTEQPSTLSALSTSQYRARLLSALERLADAAERFAPPVAELTPAEQAELDRLGALSDNMPEDLYEELVATVEMLEQRGREVPDSTYERLLMKPPKRRLAVEPTPEELSAPQPGSTQVQWPAEPVEPPRPAEPELPGVPEPPEPDGPVTSRKAGL